MQKTDGRLWSQRHTLAAILALGLAGLAGPALAQEEPEVVNDPQATEESVRLPDDLPEQAEARENAQFGMDTANKAKELGDADAGDRRDFGDATSREAREGAGRGAQKAP